MSETTTNTTIVKADPRLLKRTLELFIEAHGGTIVEGATTWRSYGTIVQAHGEAPALGMVVRGFDTAYKDVDADVYIDADGQLRVATDAMAVAATLAAVKSAYVAAVYEEAFRRTGRVPVTRVLPNGNFEVTEEPAAERAVDGAFDAGYAEGVNVGKFAGYMGAVAVSAGLGISAYVLGPVPWQVCAATAACIATVGGGTWWWAAKSGKKRQTTSDGAK